MHWQNRKDPGERKNKTPCKQGMWKISGISSVKSMTSPLEARQDQVKNRKKRRRRREIKIKQERKKKKEEKKNERKKPVCNKRELRTIRLASVRRRSQLSSCWKRTLSTRKWQLPSFHPSTLSCLLPWELREPIARCGFSLQEKDFSPVVAHSLDDRSPVNKVRALSPTSLYLSRQQGLKFNLPTKHYCSHHCLATFLPL